LERDIVEILITPETIERRIAEMGKEVAAVYKDSVPLLVGVLKGCTLFMADLIKHIKIPLEMDFMAVLSYWGARQSSGAVRIIKDLDNVIEGRDLLVVEGIVDTGMTVGYILRNLQARQPRSIRLCTFLDKPARRIVQVPIDFRGFEIPDRFVVGYGLDFHQRYRNLPYIGVLKDEVTGLSRRQEKGPVARGKNIFKKVT
jgi:hypoxanthine phosphoribosyltransferase